MSSKTTSLLEALQAARNFYGDGYDPTDADECRIMEMMDAALASSGSCTLDNRKVSPLQTNTDQQAGYPHTLLAALKLVQRCPMAAVALSQFPSDPENVALGPLGPENQSQSAMEVINAAIAQAEVSPASSTADVFIKLFSQEHKTLLAALRFYQRNGQGDPNNRTVEIHNIATADGSDISMDDTGIDALYQKIASGSYQLVALSSDADSLAGTINSSQDNGQ